MSERKRTGDLSRLTRARGARYMEAAGQAPADDRPPVLTIRVGALRPSPFQPAARPSPEAVAAVEAALREAGGLETLLSEEGGGLLARLTEEARELAALARDLAANGVDAPLEARRRGEHLELLSGHRRWNAARLAGLATVPVADLGEVDDDEAASIVFRRNRLREDLTPWQEARALLHLREQQDARGKATSVRALARMAGYSHGKAGGLLRIGEALVPLLGAMANGDEARAEAAMARVGYRVLLRVAQCEPVAERVTEAVRAAGLDGSAGPAPVRRPPAPPARLIERRSGAVGIEISRPPDALSPGEATDVLALLAPLLRTLRSRARGDG